MDNLVHSLVFPFTAVLSITEIKSENAAVSGGGPDA